MESKESKFMKYLIILALSFSLDVWSARNIQITPFDVGVNVGGTKILTDRPSTLTIQCQIAGKLQNYTPTPIQWTQTRLGFRLRLEKEISVLSGDNVTEPDNCYALLDFWSRDEIIKLGNISQKQIKIPLSRLGKSAGSFLEEILSSSEISLFPVYKNGKELPQSKLCL